MLAAEVAEHRVLERLAGPKEGGAQGGGGKAEGAGEDPLPVPEQVEKEEKPHHPIHHPAHERRERGQKPRAEPLLKVEKPPRQRPPELGPELPGERNEGGLGPIGRERDSPLPVPRKGAKAPGELLGQVPGVAHELTHDGQKPGPEKGEGEEEARHHQPVGHRARGPQPNETRLQRMHQRGQKSRQTRQVTNRKRSPSKNSKSRAATRT